MNTTLLQQFKKKIIVFSSPTNVEEEINTVTNILQTKIEAFHLRKPNYSRAEIRLFLNRIPQNLHSKIVLHSDIELLNEFDLKGYYCTRKILKEYKIKDLKIKYPKAIFSKGCHSIAELKEIEPYDYVFLSPIFNSISKSNVTSNFSIEQLENELQNLEKPVYALGGITPELAKKIDHLNFYGVGILGYLWSNKKPIQQLHQFYQ